MLVHEQGEQIDNVELAIMDTHHYVEGAESKLQEAKTLSIAARKVNILTKKMCCILLILIIVICAVLLPIIL